MITSALFLIKHPGHSHDPAFALNFSPNPVDGKSDFIVSTLEFVVVGAGEFCLSVATS